MSNQALILSREQFPELYAAIAKAYGPLPNMNRERTITENEAIDYLNLCKTAYTTAVKESDSPELIEQYRTEIVYWMTFLAQKWPGEKGKRDEPET